MVRGNSEGGRLIALERAAALVAEALDLLDAHADCPEATTHLDLALRCMRQRALKSKD